MVEAIAPVADLTGITVMPRSASSYTVEITSRHVPAQARNLPDQQAVKLPRRRVPLHLLEEGTLAGTDLPGPALLDVHALAGEFRRDLGIHMVHGSGGAADAGPVLPDHTSGEHLADLISVAPGAVLLGYVERPRIGFRWSAARY
jgi:hypothetical protein